MQAKTCDYIGMFDAKQPHSLGLIWSAQALLAPEVELLDSKDVGAGSPRPYIKQQHVKP